MTYCPGLVIEPNNEIDPTIIVVGRLGECGPWQSWDYSEEKWDLFRKSKLLHSLNYWLRKW